MQMGRHAAASAAPGHVAPLPMCPGRSFWGFPCSSARRTRSSPARTTLRRSLCALTATLLSVLRARGHLTPLLLPQMKLSMVKERVNPCRDSEGNLYTTPRLVDRSSAQCLSRARVAAMAWQCRCSAHYRSCVGVLAPRAPCRCMETERIVIESQDRLLAFCQVRDETGVASDNPCPMGVCRSDESLRSVLRTLLLSCWFRGYAEQAPHHMPVQTVADDCDFSFNAASG